MALKTNNIKIITPTTIQARITILKKGPRTWRGMWWTWKT
jgi:hypothetical protein